MLWQTFYYAHQEWSYIFGTSNWRDVKALGIRALGVYSSQHMLQVTIDNLRFHSHSC